ncbi:ATP-binding protein [Streptococcus suis]|nr:ATP-binding protein [Streptococcus suis]
MVQLLYMYVKSDKSGIKNGEFNFSNEFQVHYDCNKGLSDGLTIKQNTNDSLSNLYNQTISNITLLVGRNGTGKTSLLNALFFSDFTKKDQDSSKFFKVYHVKSNIFYMVGTFDISYNKGGSNFSWNYNGTFFRYDFETADIEEIKENDELDMDILWLKSPISRDIKSSEEKKVIFSSNTEKNTISDNNFEIRPNVLERLSTLFTLNQNSPEVISCSLEFRLNYDRNAKNQLQKIYGGDGDYRKSHLKALFKKSEDKSILYKLSFLERIYLNFILEIGIPNLSNTASADNLVDRCDIMIEILTRAYDDGKITINVLPVLDFMQYVFHKKIIFGLESDLKRFSFEIDSKEIIDELTKCVDINECISLQYWMSDGQSVFIDLFSKIGYFQK